MKYTCDNCGAKTNAFYSVDEEQTLCEDCFNDAVSRAEYAYESYREAEVTGN